MLVVSRDCLRGVISGSHLLSHLYSRFLADLAKLSPTRALGGGYLLFREHIPLL